MIHHYVKISHKLCLPFSNLVSCAMIIMKQIVFVMATKLRLWRKLNESLILNICKKLYFCCVVQYNKNRKDLNKKG